MDDDRARRDEGGKVELTFTDDTADPELEKLLDEVVAEVEFGENKECGGLTVVLTDDRELRRLNREYLGEDAPTDVLAFDLRDGPDDPIEGDIYISLDRVRERLGSERGGRDAEVLRLFVHGVLHLCGYEHYDDVSLERMLLLGEKYIGRVISRKIVGS